LLLFYVGGTISNNFSKMQLYENCLLEKYLEINWNRCINFCRFWYINKRKCYENL